VTVWLVLTVLGGEASRAGPSLLASLQQGLIALVLGWVALELLARRLAGQGYYR
jgi:hypothetical protein